MPRVKTYKVFDGIEYQYVGERYTKKSSDALVRQLRKGRWLVRVDTWGRSGATHYEIYKSRGNRPRKLYIGR